MRRRNYIGLKIKMDEDVAKKFEEIKQDSA